ncbi:hypothetical protein [Paenarthrobacter sp. PH39-S1]|uniref:hypothetical protein n=1 Tax=Paenarthrobacter sp. PH39-S1 TaxID=3046204 RepID=UPI0024BB0152|nr:hypothetical protein [Paenarthrobacter sp. PH39-S1]MDJ0355365.1 hypothetical protein [Paenarthrobacter sp. PH39-S1]
MTGSGHTKTDDGGALAVGAGRLYGLPPSEFTVERNAWAGDARANGNAELAGKIRALPKPSTAAWLLNMLVIHRRAEIDGLLEVGVELRQAQADLDQGTMRRLSKERRVLLAALLTTGRGLASELGQRASAAVLEDVEETLRAATSDAWATAAVRTGMLTRALSADGWGAADLSGAVAVPVSHAGQPDAAAGPTVPLPADKTRAAAQRKAALAVKSADEAEAALAGIRDRAAGLTLERSALAARLTELRNLVAEAARDLAAADREAVGLSREEEAAARTAASARSAADRAGARLMGR